MVEKTIALPFSIDPFGKIATTTDQRKIWGDRVKSIVGTTIGERVMNPNLGSEVALNVFENQDEAITAITANIPEVFNSQLPLLTLTGVETSFDEITGVIYANIVYGLPNDEQVTTVIGLVYLSGNNPPIEETS